MGIYASLPRLLLRAKEEKEKKTSREGASSFVLLYQAKHVSIHCASRSTPEARKRSPDSLQVSKIIPDSASRAAFREVPGRRFGWVRPLLYSSAATHCPVLRAAASSRESTEAPRPAWPKRPAHSASLPTNRLNLFLLPKTQIFRRIRPRDRSPRIVQQKRAQSAL